MALKGAEGAEGAAEAAWMRESCWVAWATIQEASHLAERLGGQEGLELESKVVPAADG